MELWNARIFISNFMERTSQRRESPIAFWYLLGTRRSRGGSQLTNSGTKSRLEAVIHLFGRWLAGFSPPPIVRSSVDRAIHPSSDSINRHSRIFRR